MPGAVPAQGGVGSASTRLANGLTVAALAAVNAAGDVVDPRTGALLASGTLDGEPVCCQDALLRSGEAAPFLHANTTLAVVATDARLTKAQAQRLATCGHDGFARAIRPVHTPFDGDTVFALATGAASDNPVTDADMLGLCAAAAEMTAAAIVRAVTAP